MGRKSRAAAARGRMVQSMRSRFRAKKRRQGQMRGGTLSKPSAGFGPRADSSASQRGASRASKLSPEPSMSRQTAWERSARSSSAMVMAHPSIGPF